MLETLVNSVFLAVTEHTTAEPASEPEPETELLPPNSISELPEKLLDSGVYLPGRYIPPPPLSSAVPGFPFSPTHNSRLSLTNLTNSEKTQNRSRNLLIN